MDETIAQPGNAHEGSHVENYSQPPDETHPEQPEPASQEAAPAPATAESEPSVPLATWERVMATNPAEADQLIPLIFPPATWKYVEVDVNQAKEGATDFTKLPTYKLFRNRLWYAFGNTGPALDDPQVKEAKPTLVEASLLSGVVPAEPTLPESLESLNERRDQPVLDENGDLKLPISMVMGFVDLSKFKALNDRRGHTFGDVGLEKMGERLSKALRDLEHGFGPAHFVAHRSGDEFVLCIPGVTQQEGANIIQRLADNLDEVAMKLDPADKNPGETVEVLRGCIAGAFAPAVNSYEEAMTLLFMADNGLNAQKQEERRKTPRAA